MNLVSVLIPTHNNIDDLYITLDSVLLQDYEKIEIIITDDGSEHFDEYKNNIIDYIECKKNSNIDNVVINSLPQNVGTVKNLNSAIPICKGNYIKILGPADYFASNSALSGFVNYMDSNNYLVCFSKVIGINDKGQKVYKMHSYNDDYTIMRKLSPEELLNCLYNRDCLHALGAFFRTRVFKLYGLFPEDYRLIEDYPYWLKLCKAGEKFGFFDEYLVNYKLNNSGLGIYNTIFIDDLTRIYKTLIFPFDNRFCKPRQKLTNALKLGGLKYYKELSLFSKKSRIQKAGTIIKYFPFHLFVNFNRMLYYIRNKKSQRYESEV